MKRLLLTFVLMAAVTVASGACCGTAEASTRPHTKRTTNTVRQKKAVKCKTCTAFKCHLPRKRRHARR